MNGVKWEIHADKRTYIYGYIITILRTLQTKMLFEICALLEFYPASYRCFGTTYRSHLQKSSCFILKDKTDRLSRNVGIKLQIYAV